MEIQATCLLKKNYIGMNPSEIKLEPIPINSIHKIPKMKSNNNNNNDIYKNKKITTNNY